MHNIDLLYCNTFTGTRSKESRSFANKPVEKAVARVSIPYFDTLSTSKSKASSSKMSLLRLSKDDTQSNLARTVSLWAGGFFSAGFVPFALKMFDPSQIYQEQMGKEGVTDTLEQLVSHLYARADKLFDMYYRLTEDGAGSHTDREILTQKEVIQYLDNLKHSHLTYKETKQAALHFINDSLQNIADKCQDRAEKLAEKVGAPKEEKQALQTQKSAGNQKTTSALQTTANHLMDKMDYVEERCRAIETVLIKRGREQIEKQAAKEGKSLEELGCEEEQELTNKSLAVGYTDFYITTNRSKYEEVNVENLRQNVVRRQLSLPIKESYHRTLLSTKQTPIESDPESQETYLQVLLSGSNFFHPFKE